MLGALCAAVLGLAACGGDGGGADENATTVISQTFSGKKEVKSGKLNMNVTAKLEGTGAAAALNEPVSLKLAGPFQSRGNDALPEVDLDLSVSGGGQTFTAGALTTGDAAFISYQGTDYRVPEGQFRRYKRRIEQDARRNKEQSNSFDFAKLGINPRDWIKDPKNEGTEEVGGAQTIHVSAGVDVGAFVDDLDNLLGRAASLGVRNQQLPTKLSEKQKTQIEKAIQDVRFDMWTGEKDKILRRVEVEFGFKLPKDLQQDAQGVQSGNIKLALEIADVNKEQEIKAPSNARPLSELQSTLGVGGALGGLGGSSGGGSSGGGSSSGGSSSGGSSSGGGSGSSGAGTDLGSGGGQSNIDPERSQKYLDCLTAAKKPADIEACAKILEK